MFNKIIRRMWKPLVLGLLVALVATLSPVGLWFNNPPEDVSSPSIELGQDQFVLTIGTDVYAAGVADYTCDGVADDVQFQAALNALPASGGKLVALTGDYVFAATVLRAIDNVTIDGMGDSTYFAFDGGTALFDAGAQDGWVFRDFRTDAGGVDVTGTEDYVITNVTVGTTTIGEIVRTATFVVSASDSSTSSKAQADYVCSGAADDVEIQAALDRLPATGGYIFFLEGTYNLGAQVIRAIDDVKFVGCGQATLLNLDGATPIITAGAQDGWLFRDFATDAGGPDISGATGSAIRSVWIAGVRTDDPVAVSITAVTFVVAASDSVDPTRADYQCSGAADDVDINAALVAGAGGKVVLLEGNYQITANIVVPASTHFSGMGKGTILTTTDAVGITNMVIINGANVTIDDMKLVLGAGAGNAGTRPNIIYANTKTLILLEKLWLVGDRSVADDASDQRQCGILFTTVTDSKIIACRIEDNDRHGIALDTSSDYNTISDNTCEGNGYNGIRLDDSSLNDITGNTSEGNTWNGILLDAACDNNTISGNTFEGNGQQGIYLDASPDGNTISGNICLGNNGHGILLISAHNNTISGNTCQGNIGIGSGIALNASTNNTLTGNTCNENAQYGIFLATGSDDNTISGNTCNDNTRDGIYLGSAGCDSNTITGNTCIENDFNGNTYSGIALYFVADENVISGNRCEGNGLHGISILRSSYCTISGNICTDNNTGDGINITGNASTNSDHNEVTGNLCSDNTSHGIEVAGGTDANDNRVINNKLTNNTAAEFADAGVNTQLATYVVPFVDGTDPQDSGFLIDANTEMARAWLRLPPEVQQVVGMKVYARSVVGETHEMELEMVVYGGADNEAYTIHNGSIAQLDSVSVNFAADDIIFWLNTEAGVLALVGGDSVEVKVLHEAVEGDNIDTQAYFRTIEIHYV